MLSATPSRHLPSLSGAARRSSFVFVQGVDVFRVVVGVVGLIIQEDEPAG